MRSSVDLDPGEQLIWAGAPRALRYAAAKGRQPFFAGIVACGFALYWMHMGAIANFPFTPFGILALISGATVLSSPVWHFRRGLRASYALTDRRAILDLATGRTSVPLTQVQYVDVRRFAGGGGDIYFTDAYVPAGDAYDRQKNGFVAITDVARVEQLLRAAIDKAVTNKHTPSEPMP